MIEANDNPRNSFRLTKPESINPNVPKSLKYKNIQSKLYIIVYFQINEVLVLCTPLHTTPTNRHLYERAKKDVHPKVKTSCQCCSPKSQPLPQTEMLAEWFVKTAVEMNDGDWYGMIWREDSVYTFQEGNQQNNK